MKGAYVSILVAWDIFHRIVFLTYFHARSIGPFVRGVTTLRSARKVLDENPNEVLDRLCLPSSLCTLKRVRQGMRAKWTLTHSNGQAVVMRCYPDMKKFAVHRGVSVSEREG